MTSLIFSNRNRTPSVFDSFFNNDNLFDDVFRTPSLRMFAQKHPVKFHVEKSDEAFDIEIAAPGISKDQVDVNIKEDVLSVAYDQKQEEDGSFFCSSFSKSWTLPKDIDVDKVSASYSSGIFKINLPRIQPVEPEIKKIKVK